MMKRKMTVLLLVVMTVLCMAGCAKEKKTVNVGSLKGPTSIGILKMMADDEAQATNNDYEFIMAVGADELLPKMVSKELDIALVPANVASVLYNKTEGGIQVIDINTLGVLYMVSGDHTLTDLEQLSGKTVYLTGKGTTPDYVLQYLLKAYNISEQVTLEYKSEATEVAAILAENPSAVGLLPQPFVTAALAQNEKLSVVFDTTALWQQIQGEGGSRQVTGVTIVRKEFLQENEKAVQAFLEEHKASAAYALEDTEAVAAMCEEKGIIAKAAIAQKAIPACNITCLEGEEMKQALGGYLEVLFELEPASVGGALPGDDFYYCP